MSESIVPDEARRQAENLFQSQQVNLVAAKEKVAHTKEQGVKKNVGAVEVLEEARREVARSRMTEEQKEWKDQKGLGRFARRWYFYGVNNLAHYRHQKEQAYIELAEAGLQMSAFHVDFQRDLNNAALKRVEGQRNQGSGLKKRAGETLDFINAATFTQTRLEKERITILRELRTLSLAPQGEYDRILQTPANDRETRMQQLLLDNPHLLNNFKQELTGDFTAAESLAQRLSEGCSKDAIRSVIGEKKHEGEVVLRKDTNESNEQKEFRLFLQKEIILPLLKDGLTTGTLSQDRLLQARTQMQEVFFTKRFAQFRESLDPAAREVFDVSLSYGSDVIPMVERMLPHALNIKEYLLAENRLEDYMDNMVLTVHVGTLKSGEQGTVNEGMLEKATARSLTNRKVERKYRALMRGREPIPVVPNAYYDQASQRANALCRAQSFPGAAGAFFLNHFWGATAAGTGIALYMGKSALKAKANLLAPFIGGAAVSAGIRAAEEYQRFNRKKEYHRRQNAQGYEFPADAPERRIFRNGDLPIMNIQEQISQLDDIGTKLQGTIDQNIITEALGRLADVEGRRIIMDTHEDVEMYGKSLYDNMNTKRRELVRSRCETVSALKTYYASHQTELITLAGSFGISIPPVPTGSTPEDVIIDHILLTLGQSRAENLQNGTALDANFVTALQSAGLDTLDKAETICERNKVLNKAQWTVIRKTAGRGGLMGVGIPLVEHFIAAPALSWAVDNVPPIHAAAGLIGNAEQAVAQWEPIRGIAHAIGKISDTIGHATTEAKAVVTKLVSHPVGKHFNFDLPQGYTATQVDATHLKITGPDGSSHDLGFVDDAQGAHFTDSPTKVASEIHQWFPQLKMDTQMLHSFAPQEVNPASFNPATDALAGTDHTINLGGQSTVINLPNNYHYVGFDNAKDMLSIRVDGDPSIHNFHLTPDANGYIRATDDTNESFLMYVQHPPTASDGEALLASQASLEQNGISEQANLPVVPHDNFSEWTQLTGKWRGYEAAGGIDQGAHFPDANSSTAFNWNTQHNGLYFDQRITDGNIQANPIGFESAEKTMMETRPDLFPTLAKAQAYLQTHPDLLGPHQDASLNDIIHDNMSIMDTLPNGTHAIPTNYIAEELDITKPNGQTEVLLVHGSIPKNLPRSWITKIRWGIVTQHTSTNPHALINPNTITGPLGSNAQFQELASKPVQLTDNPVTYIVPGTAVNTVKFELLPQAYTPMTLPITPLPWIASHRPLEAPEKIQTPDGSFWKGSYGSVAFNPEFFMRKDGKPATCADIVRFRGEPLSTDNPLGTFFPSNSPGGTVARVEKQRNSEALKAIHNTFIDSEHIYVILSGAIGDVVTSSAYIEGLKEYADSMGKKKKITILAPTNIISFIDPLVKHSGFNMVPIKRYEGSTEATNIIRNNNEKNAIVFEFEHHTGLPVVDRLPNDGLLINDLFAASVGLYPHSRSGNERFSQFLGDILSIPENQQRSIKAHFDLPDNSDVIYDKIKREENIDPNRRQVAIVVEASDGMKRWALHNWQQLIQKLQAQYGDVDVNIIYNKNQGGSYPQQEIQNAFGSFPHVRLISRSPQETIVLLANQNVVISNDTGLAHVAAVANPNATRQGPQVISLHIAPFPPDVWVTDAKRHRGIMANSIGNINDPDENKKWINSISPEEVFQEVQKDL